MTHWYPEAGQSGDTGPGGGGSTPNIYWWGCAHQKRGVLGADPPPKKIRGVFGAGTTRRGGGGLKHVYNPTKGEFRTGFVKGEGVRNWSCTKWGLGSLFIYFLSFYLSTWSTGEGMFWQAEKGGPMCGSNSKKGGLRYGSGKKRYLPRHIPILNIYVSAPGYTGIIWKFRSMQYWVQLTK